MEKTKDVVTRVFANNFAGNLAYSMLSVVKTNNSDVLNIRADFLSDLGRSININTEVIQSLYYMVGNIYSQLLMRNPEKYLVSFLAIVQ